VKATRTRQHGSALVLVLGVLALFAAYVAIGKLNSTTVRVARDRATLNSLSRAKEALIAYAASDVNRPGELPCPDVNDDGKIVFGEDMVGSACTSLVGRLPWVTLGLPDMRDDAGERLWYALSNDFHANGSVPLNNETAYRAGNTSLTVLGEAAASNVVAVIFSPGTALVRADGLAQSRACTAGNCDANGKCISTPASATPRCNAANYLDVSGGEDNADANGQFVAAASSQNFNDRLALVVADDIMALVQRRAGRQIAQHLRDQFDAWQATTNPNLVGAKGFYPWAATFGDPSTAKAGVNNTLNGLVPFSAPVWASGSYSLLGIPTNCSGINTREITCAGIINFGFPTITATINVGSGLIGPPVGTEVSYDSGIIIGAAPTWTLDSATQKLTFSMSGLALGLPTTIRIRVPAPATDWATWLTDNNWQQNAYYALSQGYSIAGNGACGAGPLPACVTVTNWAGTQNDKQAVVVMTGRALPLTTPAQPTTRVGAGATVANFLEGGNQSATDGVFEHNLRTAQFNDDPVVVRP
jgi:hypothetical protein